MLEQACECYDSTRSSINTNKILSGIYALVSLACCSGFVQLKLCAEKKEVGGQLCPTVQQNRPDGLGSSWNAADDLGARGDDPDLPSHGSW